MSASTLEKSRRESVQSRYVLTLPRIVELLCREGLADIERNEPSWNRGRMLSRDASGVRRVEAVARQNDIRLNRSSLSNLLPRPDKLPTRNPSVGKTLQGIKEMLDLWVIIDPNDPEHRRIQFKSAGEIADLHAQTYDHLESDADQLRRALKKRLDDVDAALLKRVEEMININNNNGQQALRRQLEQLLEQSEQIPVSRLAIAAQTHLTKSGSTKLEFAQAAGRRLEVDQDQVDQVATTQRCLDVIEALLNSFRLADDIEALQAVLTLLAEAAEMPDESGRAFTTLDALLDWCGFARDIQSQ